MREAQLADAFSNTRERQKIVLAQPTTVYDKQFASRTKEKGCFHIFPFARSVHLSHNLRDTRANRERTLYKVTLKERGNKTSRARLR